MPPEAWPRGKKPAASEIMPYIKTLAGTPFSTRMACMRLLV